MDSRAGSGGFGRMSAEDTVRERAIVAGGGGRVTEGTRRVGAADDMRVRGSGSPRERGDSEGGLERGDSFASDEDPSELSVIGGEIVTGTGGGGSGGRGPERLRFRSERSGNTSAGRTSSGWPSRNLSMSCCSAARNSALAFGKFVVIVKRIAGGPGVGKNASNCRP
jgi:hypothetical protein